MERFEWGLDDILSIRQREGPMSFQFLTMKKNDGVCWITLNRPDAANSLSLTLAREFRDAITDVTSDSSCHVLVIAGNGRYFCSGGDIIGMTDAIELSLFTRLLADTMHDALIALARSSLITIAAIHGPAAGAGLGIVLNADLVIASPDASFVSAYSRVGLTPDCGVSYLLPRSIGPGRAASMILAGQVIDAAKALDWGLVTEVVDGTRLRARVEDLAAQLATESPQVLASTKMLLNSDRLAGYSSHLLAEAETIATMSSHPDSQALLRGFTNRSKAKP
jgi:2-(1,2-epoxy-1,2-dihydrophenyl)acetyl-CoA isomerase